MAPHGDIQKIGKEAFELLEAMLEQKRKAPRLHMRGNHGSQCFPTRDMVDCNPGTKLPRGVVHVGDFRPKKS